jgi:hypothetical protein
MTQTNCFAESWISHFKREVLNHIFCFSLRHLDYVTQNYADYHNNYRPHQGLNNRPPASLNEPPPEIDDSAPRHTFTPPFTPAPPPGRATARHMETLEAMCVKLLLTLFRQRPIGAAIV